MTRILYMNECMNECRIYIVCPKLPLCPVKMFHHVGFHSSPAHMSPTYVIILYYIPSQFSFPSHIKQQFFQAFHQSFILSARVPQVQAYQGHSFCWGTEG